MPLAQHPIASPFGHGTQALEVVKGIDLSGKTAIVTGGSFGIGIETALPVPQAGARVILPVRSRMLAEEAAAGIRKGTGNGEVGVSDMDLGDWASVRTFADGFLSAGQPLHILIKNAGIMATPAAHHGQRGVGPALTTRPCRWPASWCPRCARRTGGGVPEFDWSPLISGSTIEFQEALMTNGSLWPSKSANALFAGESPPEALVAPIPCIRRHHITSSDMSAEINAWAGLTRRQAREGFKTPAAVRDRRGARPRCCWRGRRRVRDCNIAEPNRPDSRLTACGPAWIRGCGTLGHSENAGRTFDV